MRDTTPFADCPFALDGIAVIPLLSAVPDFVFSVQFRTHGTGFGCEFHAEVLVTGVISFPGSFSTVLGALPGYPPTTFTA
jgi:hypothetical protein